MMFRYIFLNITFLFYFLILKAINKLKKELYHEKFNFFKLLDEYYMYWHYTMYVKRKKEKYKLTCS